MPLIWTKNNTKNIIGLWSKMSSFLHLITDNSVLAYCMHFDIKTEDRGEV